MQTETFLAKNIKCGGCAGTIREGLQSLDGVEQVEVDIDSGRVSVHGTSISRATVSAKLAALGYPEA